MNNAFWTEIETSVNERYASSILTSPPILEQKNNKPEPPSKESVEYFSETIDLFVNKRMRASNKLALIEAETYAPEITTSPTRITGKKKTERSLLKKIQARTREKIISLDKILDTYGVVDSLTRHESGYKINARIYNLNDHEILDEITFSSSEFSVSDQKKLVENAIFYWYVGIEKTLFGQVKRVSEFRLRRIFNSNKL